MARQRLDRGELAHVALQAVAGAARRRNAPRQPALDEGGQAAEHGLARAVGNRPARRLRRRQHIGGQHVAAAAGLGVARREVVRQAVAVEVGRQLVHQRAPARRVAQADRARGALLQAAVRIDLEPAPEARQRTGQRRPERHLHATDAGQRVGRRRHRPGQRAGSVHLPDRRLHHAHRHGRLDLLRHLDAVTRALSGRGADLLGRAGPGQRPHARRHADRPAQLGRTAGRYRHLLRRQRQRPAQRRLDRHRARRRVAQRPERLEAVALAHQRRQPRQHLQILRDADRRRAAAEAVELRTTAGGHRDKAEGAQRVVQRHLQRRAALRVELHVRAPQQQRVEQLARRVAPAAAARRQRLAAVVAPADDLVVRRRRLDAPGARREHRAEQIPGVVVHQRQQPLVDRRERHRAAGQRPAVGQQHLHAGARGLAHAVLGFLWLDLHGQPVVVQADAQRRHAELERRLGQIDQRGRRGPLRPLLAPGVPPQPRRAPAPVEERVPRHLPHPPAQHQRADVDVGRPARRLGRVGAGGALRDRHLDDRIAAAQRDDARVENALALDRHQHGGLAKGHAHLQPRGLAGAQVAPLGQQVDAVVVVLVEPEFAAAADPHRAAGGAAPAAAVGGLRDQAHLARRRQVEVAGQQAARVGLAAAQPAEVADLLLRVIGVEAADDLLARRRLGALLAAQLHRLAGLRLAGGVEHDHLHRHPAALRQPAARADADHHRRRPQHHAAADRLALAVRVVEAELGDELGRHLQRPHRIGQRHLGGRRALRVGAQRLAVGQQLLAHAVGRLAAGDARVRAALGRRREAVVLVVRKLHPGRAQQRVERRRCRQPAARQVAELHAEAQLARRDLRPGRRLQPRVDQRHLERLDAELPRRPRRAAAVLERHVIDALPGVRRNRPGHRRAIRQRGHVAAGLVGDVDLVGLRRRGQRRQPPGTLAAQVMAHRHRLADAQQRAVEHRVRAHRVGVVERAARGRLAEAPRLDAAAPVAEDEGQVAAAVGTRRAARGDEQAVVADAVAARPALVQAARNARQPLCVGAARPQRHAAAVVDGDIGAGHRLRAVQRRDPDQAVAAAALEVHADRRHQHAGAHVHRRLAVEQRAPEHAR